MASQPPAGWYPDNNGVMRWWDGQTWTDQVQDSQTQVQPQVPVPPAPKPSGFLDRVQADAVAGAVPRQGADGQQYVVLQVVLKEKMWGSGSGNLTELERAINAQAALGYRLHTISTSSSGSVGFGGGDRIQATLVFERIG